MSGGPGELYGAVVLHLADRVWSLEEVFPVFTIGCHLDHYLLSNSVLVVAALSVLASVVKINHALLVLTNQLPISFERDVEERVAPKHKLGRRGSHGGVYSRVDCSTNC